MVTQLAPSIALRLMTDIEPELSISEASERYHISKVSLYRLVNLGVVGWRKPSLRGEALLNHADLRVYLHAHGKLDDTSPSES